MSMPISPAETPQNVLFKQEPGSDSGKIENPATKLDPARLNGQSIMALLNTIMLQLQEYASWMRDTFLSTAAELVSENMEYAFDALKKTQESAEQELSAKRGIYGAQIAAGVFSIGIAAGGCVVANAYYRNRQTSGEGVIGIGMLGSSVAGGGSNIITSSAEIYNSGPLNEARIREAQANNQRQLFPVLDTLKSQQSNFGEQMSNQFQRINDIWLDIVRSFGKFFETPLV